MTPHRMPGPKSASKRRGYADLEVHARDLRQDESILRGGPDPSGSPSPGLRNQPPSSSPSGAPRLAKATKTRAAFPGDASIQTSRSFVARGRPSALRRSVGADHEESSVSVVQHAASGSSRKSSFKVGLGDAFLQRCGLPGGEEFLAEIPGDPRRARSSGSGPQVNRRVLFLLLRREGIADDSRFPVRARATELDIHPVLPLLSGRLANRRGGVFHGAVADGGAR